MSGHRPPPVAPRPGLLRQPQGPYGWLDVRLLTEHHLSQLGPEPVAVLVFLALTADRRGASWWSRSKMAAALGMNLEQVDRGLQRLLERELIAHRPWRRGQADGVWQILPMTEPAPRPRAPDGSAIQSLGGVLDDLREDTTEPPSSPPESRAF